MWQFPKWQWHKEWSTVFSGVGHSSLRSSGAFSGVLGGRTTALWEKSNFTLGQYYEQFFQAGHSPSAYQLPWRLNPLFGHYFIWSLSSEWAVGGLLEWSPNTLNLRTLDAMVSFRQSPLNLNIYLKTLPLGVQVQTQFSAF